MSTIDRRAFLTAGSAALATRYVWGAASGSAAVDATLRNGIAARKLPAVVAMAAGESKTLYEGAFGTRDVSGTLVRTDSLFQIASMTKAVTTVAALQLVEQGKVDLGEPVSRHLPVLADLDVLEGVDADGMPRLRPARTPITLRHLLTHTSGFCYDTWDGDMFRYASRNSASPPTKPGPLMFEPGKRWQYGPSVDWAGRLVEALSGTTLEQYFQEDLPAPGDEGYQLYLACGEI
jgi:CubicO group peptidase (beta-lactamase class C family)